MTSRPVAFITGASRGLGRALALRFAAGGWAVGVNNRAVNADTEEVVDRARAAGGEADALPADVRSGPAIQSAIEGAMTRWGRLDLLIHAAGLISDRPLLAMSEAEWDAVIDVHLKGGFHLVRAAAPAMEKSGGGQILIILSWAGLNGRAGQANYAAAKAGLIGLIRSAARELAGQNIRINGVVPAAHLIGMGSALSPAQRNAIGRTGLFPPATTADAFADLVFDLGQGHGVTGQILQLDSRIP